MIGIGIAFVLVGLLVRSRNHPQSAVIDGCIMYGDPHGGALKWVGDLEVGVVLMPAGAGTDTAGFEEHLIQMQQVRIAEQARYGGDDAIVKG